MLLVDQDSSIGDLVTHSLIYLPFYSSVYNDYNDYNEYNVYNDYNDYHKKGNSKVLELALP